MVVQHVNHSAVLAGMDLNALGLALEKLDGGQCLFLEGVEPELRGSFQ